MDHFYCEQINFQGFIHEWWCDISDLYAIYKLIHFIMSYIELQRAQYWLAMQ